MGHNAQVHICVRMDTKELCVLLDAQYTSTLKAAGAEEEVHSF